MKHQSLDPKPYSVWMAESVMLRGQGIASADGDTGQWLRVGVFQRAVFKLMAARPSSTQDHWLDHLEKGSASVVDAVLDAGQKSKLSMDRLSLGAGLFYQYHQTQKTIYRDALDALRESLILQPKNSLGGYWYFHYPHLSYLDGMFSLIPFLLQYTKRTDPSQITTVNDDVLHQLDLLWDHCHHDRTGLLVHGYDASKMAVWADPITGGSPNVWGRAVGWYVMALLDVLDEIEVAHESASWQHLHEMFKNLMEAVVSTVDPTSGCWWQDMSHPGEPGNFLESSCSAMFVYALHRGVRLGYLDDGACTHIHNGQTSTYSSVAYRAYDSIIDRFVVHNADGTLSYDGTVAVCSLNSSATYQYYVEQPISYDNVLGSAAFVLASTEQEIIA